MRPFASAEDMASPAKVKVPCLLISFAAPIIGGASLAGGHVSPGGTLIAVLLIALIQNGIVLVGVDQYWMQFVLGALIVAAVGINRWRAVRAGTN